MMFKKKRCNIHYAWVILLGCCMLQGGTLGAVTNISGLFYVPVCTELGFSVAQLTLYRTIAGVVALFTLPMVSKLLNRYDSRIVLTVASLIFILPTICMSRFTGVMQWYIAGALQGLSSNFVSIVAAPLILTNWFQKKTGLAIGISTASSGVMGALFNYGVSAVIEKSGWRMGYLTSGLTALAIVLISTLFIIRYRPEEKGMCAYGADENEQKLQENSGAANSWSEAERKQRMFMVMLAAVCAGCAGAFSSFLNAFGSSVGLTVSAAAFLASMGMIGNTVGKLIVGELNDCVGTRWPSLLGYGFAMLGGIAMLTTNVPVIYGASLLFGFSMPVYTTLMPLLTRAALGDSDFEGAYPKVTMASSLTASLMTTGHGWLYDVTGSYTCSVSLCIAAMGMGCILMLLLFWKTKKNVA